jgi:peptidoglycan/LPS O-acetylase OafA/YrhL
MRGDIPQLHAVRALAMAAIFFHHLWQGSAALRVRYADTLLDAAGMDMALGVVVFNVMTAFLMGLPLFGSAPAPAPAFGPAVRKRLVRLCPQYYLAVLGLTAASAAVFHLSDWPGLAWATLSHLLFLDTFQVSPFYGNMAAYWWLGLLVQFTLVFPWLAGRMHRPGAWCLAAAIVLWPASAWIKARGAALPGTGWEAFAFLWTFNLPARLPEFLCGLWLAKAWREHAGGGWPLGRGPALFLGGGCLLALASAVVPGAPSLGHMTGAVWSLGAFAVLFALPGVAALGRLPAVRLVSTLSYGIYLCHQPLLSFCGPATQGLAPWTRFAVTAVAAGAGSLAGAMLLDRGAARVIAWLEPGKAAVAVPAGSQKRMR